MRKIFRVISLLSASLLTGCALPHSGMITSDPPGATVSIVYVEAAEPKAVGTTPCKIKVQNWMFSQAEYVVFELDGYLPDVYPIPNLGSVLDSRPFEMHTALLKDHSVEIPAEKEKITPDVKRKALEVLATYDKMLSSPRMLAGIAASEGKAATERMVLDHPEIKDSALHKTLNVLSLKAERLHLLPSYEYNQLREAGLALQVRHLIESAKVGLGL